MKSTLNNDSGFHVAIIMDGNGRWAQQRGLPRIEGHLAGVESVRQVVEACPSLGITTLTVYAFSSDNWKRPKAEVNQLMRFFFDYFQKEKLNCIHNNVRISVIGQRSRLPYILRGAIEMIERATAHCDGLHFRIAIDYSSRDAILHAAARLRLEKVYTQLTFSRVMNELYHDHLEVPDVDLLIRTSGEQRLSDFLLWESAYAELYFTDTLWPDFRKADLEKAVLEFHHRNRRFGGICETQTAI